MTGPPNVLILVAAGRGLRAGGELPKQYRAIGGKPVLRLTIEAILAAEPRLLILPVIHPDDQALYRQALDGAGSEDKRLLPPAMGGATRQESVRAGLRQVLERLPETRSVLVHDAARPFVSSALMRRAIEAAQFPAAAPALPVTDTIKRVDDADTVEETLDRSKLRSVQTPQVFRFDILMAAHLAAADRGLDHFTDDASLVEWFGEKVRVFAGDAANVKLTTPDDFEAAERRLRPHPSGALTARVGTGYDVHAFGPGDHVWLGGVSVPHDSGVIAHSDGDVALHALCDAIFGALGDGDIGQHFPPSDERWKGASSDRFLAFACRRVAERGGVIDHLDVTIVCEAPKIGPHREAMRARIAAIAGVAPGRVGLKATTSERLGFTGRSEGLAALATATLRLPEEPT